MKWFNHSWSGQVEGCSSYLIECLKLVMLEICIKQGLVDLDLMQGCDLSGLL